MKGKSSPSSPIIFIGLLVGLKVKKGLFRRRHGKYCEIDSLYDNRNTCQDWKLNWVQFFLSTCLDKINKTTCIQL